MNKLKERWNIDSNWQVIAIIVVFAVTGSTASLIGKPILAYLNISPETFTTLGYWVVRIILLFIMYQFLLVCFGWLFGQFEFFWNFEKKMIRRLGLKRFIE